jgi:hypothetical protein
MLEPSRLIPRFKLFAPACKSWLFKLPNIVFWADDPGRVIGICPFNSTMKPLAEALEANWTTVNETESTEVNPLIGANENPVVRFCGLENPDKPLDTAIPVEATPNEFDWKVSVGTTFRISMSTLVTCAVRVGDGVLGNAPLAETTPVSVATKSTIMILAFFLFKWSPPYHDSTRESEPLFLINIKGNNHQIELSRELGILEFRLRGHDEVVLAQPVYRMGG